MRVRIVALAAVLLVAGCGSALTTSPGASTSVGTLTALLKQPGEDVSLVAGTSDYEPGAVRLSFLVVDRHGRSSGRPRARVWLATALEARPFERATAALESIGVPGTSRGDTTVTHLYVVHLRVPRPGKYWVLAEPVGGRPIQAVGNLLVNARTTSPRVGSKALRSRTPTLASAHGDVSTLTTRVPPDRALLRYSVAGSLAARKPFVVVFATPKFCTSRTCGPVVDVVDRVRQLERASGIRFIHVEIYRRNNPALGPNRWVRQWKLPSEPWTFLVGRDGRIKAKFEGALSVAELDGGVRRLLRTS